MICNVVWLFVLALATLAVNPARADVVPISIFQHVSGSGDAFVCADPSTMCAEGNLGDSFEFAAPPGPQDGAASASTGGRSASAEASASQVSVISASQLTVGLDALSSVSTFGNFVNGEASSNSQYSLVFHLTNPSVVHLTGTGEFFDINDGSGNASGSFDVQIQFAGPGIQFECQGVDHCLPAIDDALFSLGSGIYTLSAIVETSANARDNSSAIDSFDLSLNADFTAIPEPYWTPILPALLLVGGCSIGRHRKDHAG